MIKLGLSIEDSVVEADVDMPELVPDASAAATTSNMEDVD
jgi:hypothetical protein